MSSSYKHKNKVSTWLLNVGVGIVIALSIFVLGESDASQTIYSQSTNLHTKEDVNQLKFTSVQETWIKEHPVIRFGYDRHWPPFEFLNENEKYVGISSGFLDEVRKRLEVSFEQGPTITWDETLKAIDDKSIDIITMITPNKRRAKTMLFTKPYVTFPAVIVTRIDSSYIHDLNDLKGKKVAVGKSYITHEALIDDHPEIIPYPQDNITEILTSVQSGKVAAALVNLAAYTYETNRLNLSDLKVAAPTEYSYDLAMGIRKDWPELVEILNLALDSIDYSTRSAIKSRWINISYQFGLDVKSLYYWGSGIVGILLFFFLWIYYWNRLLQKKISESDQELKKQTHDLKERVKEQTCLYGFSSLMEQKGISIHEMINLAVNLLPPGWQYPEITAAKICYKGYCANTNNFKETLWMQKSDVFVNQELVGFIQVVYTETKSKLDEGPFLAEERKLINELAKQLGINIEKRLDDEKLRKLNTDLEKMVIERTAALEEAKAQNLSILDSAGEGIFGLDTNNCITFCNQSSANMLGYKIKDLIGKDIHSTIHYAYSDGDEYPEDKCPIYAAQNLQKKQFVDDEVFWRKDGSSIPIEYTAVPMYRDDDVVGSVVVFREITERIEAQKLISTEIAERKQSEMKAKSVANELKVKLVELDRFKNIAVDRELKMIELKSEINQLLTQLGKTEKYKIITEDDVSSDLLS